MSETFEGNITPERHMEVFQKLFLEGQWLASIRYAIQNGVSLAHKDPEGIPSEDLWSVYEAVRRIKDAQDRAKRAGDRSEFDRLEEEFRLIVFELIDPESAQEEYDQTRRDFDDPIIDRRPTKEELDNFVVTPEQWNTALTLYHKDRWWMIAEAMKSRDKGTSHRTPPFLVGCTAMGIEPNRAIDDPVLYSLGNVTLAPGGKRGKDKRCAERNALDAARGQAKVIVAMVTVSKETSTGDPTKAHDVLHPCRDCRDMFRELLAEGFLRNDTVLCGVNDAAKELKIEERTLADLLSLYADDVHQET